MKSNNHSQCWSVVYMHVQYDMKYDAFNFYQILDESSMIFLDFSF